ncbi:hypothetical protein MMC26_002039 [Xylographa opegraphella]|nr:hypothetical protein [Xylographa opegraphella]
MTAPEDPSTWRLTEEQKQFFLDNGYLHIENCFSRAQVAEWTKHLWTRLGFDPNDKRTWTRERTNMPFHRAVDVHDFAPKAWAYITQLCGGEERIAPSGRDCQADDHAKQVIREAGADRHLWTDNMIVNLGTPEGEGKTVHGRDLQGWHVDGDNFVHYLDSPEQGLLVTPLFSDVLPNGGGTMLCPDSIAPMARHLYAHPEGVSPRYTPRGDNPTFDFSAPGGTFYADTIARYGRRFEQATGACGDVYLIHPLMLHTHSNNSLRAVRIIINPPVTLREPFGFDRPAGDYSLVERATLRALGRESLPGWRITVPRQQLVPPRLERMARMKREEFERLERERVGGEVKGEGGKGWEGVQRGIVV